MEKCKSLCILRTGICWFKWSDDLCFGTQKGFELSTPSLPESNHLLRDYCSRALFLFLTCATIGQFQQLDSVSTKALNTKWFICCFCLCKSCVFVSLFRLRLLFSNHYVVPVFYRLSTKQFFRIDSSWRRSPFWEGNKLLFIEK